MASRFRIGTALLGATAALAFSALPAHADVTITPDRGGSEQGHRVWLKVLDKDNVEVPKDEPTSVIKLRITDDENRSNVFAYCVELPTPLLDDDILKEVDWEKHPGKNTKFTGENPGKVLWILNRSYPNKSVKEVKDEFPIKDLNKEDIIAATQAALWHFSDDAKLDVNNKKNDPQVVELYKTFLAKATPEAAPKPTLTITPESKEGVPGTPIGPFEVKTTADEVKLTGNLPAGVTVVGKDGKPLDVQQKSDGLSIKGTEKISEFSVIVPTGTPDGQATFKLSAQADIAVGRLFVAHNKSSDNVAQSLVVAQPQKAKVEKEAKATWKAGTGPTQPTTTTTTATTTTTPETTTPTTSTTPANPAPGGGEDDLASTGASILWPLLGGLVLVGAGVGALFVVRRNKAGA
ncbi:LPXTG-motif cell wall anchor domain-containing protein/TQXA domain-containing protein [Lentzea albidocapillata subsp. violacea]|uniref:LPXTG-motif cell wall anchor domain-containing protein/TQXA domain-containing protein n=1 Tax=Lentzea albidocapillata subsp. violacea TaxID=128104 RepID=A0A1G9DSY9_9PSEU|nr:thioester domain-containing protein [Lentzea albidocapillata]SDK66920.1 LPXTG-motif cell wall anchor domain-containing protein/TQXA domain-containing protein [Lentzea albidocapillata subsp. violacea]